MSLLEQDTDESVDILFVDDDYEDFQLTEAMLKSGKNRGFRLNWSESFEAGIANLVETAPAACLVDYHLGGLTGIDFVREAKARGFDGPIIILTGREDDDLDQQALAAGAEDYLEKNTVNANLLARTIRYAIHRKQLERQLLTLASRDPLTGLRNRSSFDEELKRVINACVRTGREAGLLLLDIDHFKRINDSLGHQIGDAVLKHTAERLRSCSRNIDIISRWGGDEFAIVAENVGSVSDAGAFAERVVEVMRAPIHHDGITIHTSVSVGLLYCRADIARKPDLLKWADQALYRAKELGRDRYAFFDEIMNLQAERRQRTRDRLTDALASGACGFAGQPMIDTRTGDTVGMELFARVGDGPNALIAADEMVAAADEGNLIWDLTRAELKEAASWHQKFVGGDSKFSKISINLSSRQVRRADTIQHLKNVVFETGIPAEWIDLEIPEAGLSEDPVLTRMLLDELKTVGFSLTLDNYTSNSIALMHLRLLPLDRIKIGRSLVEQVVQNSQMRAIMSCLTDLAEMQGVQVVALGVENSDQSESLVRLGCVHQQGHYFAQPLPIADVTII